MGDRVRYVMDDGNVVFLRASSRGRASPPTATQVLPMGGPHDPAEISRYREVRIRGAVKDVVPGASGAGRYGSRLGGRDREEVV
jgi:hypothetical protein